MGISGTRSRYRVAQESGILRFKRISAIFPNGDFFSAPDVDQRFHRRLPLSDAIGDDGVGDFFRRFITSTLMAVTVRKMHPLQGRLATSLFPALPPICTDAAEADVSHPQPDRLPENGERKPGSVPDTADCPDSSDFKQWSEPDPAFMPPSVSLRSAPPLFMMLRRQIDALLAKVEALYGFHREPTKKS